METPLMKEIVPADLHDRPYLKDWLDKPADKEMLSTVFKKLDGAESLLGRPKIGVPGKDAKPEEVEAFYKSLGAEKPDDYEFDLGEKPDEVFMKELRAAAHSSRLSKTQMSKFIGALTPGFKTRQKAAAEAQEARDKEFDALIEKAYSKDNAKVFERTNAAIKEFTPLAYKPFIDTLDNKALAVLVGVVNSVLEKYLPEDKLTGGDTGAGGGEKDKAALQKEARELMAHESYRNFQHADHEKTTKRIAEIYASSAFKK